MATKTDYTLTYLTQEELDRLREVRIIKLYSWTRKGQTNKVQVEFHLSSASYITIYFDGQPLDCINVWDYQEGVPLVRTVRDLRRAVAEYWKDKAIVRDMIRGGLGMDCPPLPELAR